MPDNVTLHTGDSHELLPPFLAELAEQGRNVDFVIVDGDHSSEGVRRDLEDLLNSTRGGADGDPDPRHGQRGGPPRRRCGAFRGLAEGRARRARLDSRASCSPSPRCATSCGAGSAWCSSTPRGSPTATAPCTSSATTRRRRCWRGRAISSWRGSGSRRPEATDGAWSGAGADAALEAELSVDARARRARAALSGGARRWRQLPRRGAEAPGRAAPTERARPAGAREHHGLGELADDRAAAQRQAACAARRCAPLPRCRTPLRIALYPVRSIRWRVVGSASSSPRPRGCSRRSPRSRSSPRSTYERSYRRLARGARPAASAGGRARGVRAGADAR